MRFQSGQMEVLRPIGGALQREVDEDTMEFSLRYT